MCGTLIVRDVHLHHFQHHHLREREEEREGGGGRMREKEGVQNKGEEGA